MQADGYAGSAAVVRLSQVCASSCGRRSIIMSEEHVSSYRSGGRNDNRTLSRRFPMADPDAIFMRTNHDFNR